MSYLYVYEHGGKLSISGNRIEVSIPQSSTVRSIPIEGVESICLIGEVLITSRTISVLLKRNIQLLWLSPTGEFFGRLINTAHYNITRECRQFKRQEDLAFCLALARQWIHAKLRNQAVLLKRYQRQRRVDVSQWITQVEVAADQSEKAQTRDALMGYEGTGARAYFSALSALVDPDFRFQGRTRRPPTDPFNALLSFGYTLLLYDFFTILTSKGLNPYIGTMHAIRNGHPALCSDLMEEWRCVIVDALVLHLFNKHSFTADDFQPPAENGGVFLTREGAKRFIAAYEEKVRTMANYLPYVDAPVSFRRAMELQAGQYISAVEQNDPGRYQAVIIR